MYFGTIDGPLASMQEINCKALMTPISAENTKFSTELQYENGGAGVVSSVDGSRKYDLSFYGSFYDEDLGRAVDTVMDYYNGQYGEGLIYFDDPTIPRGQNVLRRNWATPALGEIGYQFKLDRGYPDSALYGEYVDVTPGYGSPGRALKIMRGGPIGTNPSNYITTIGYVAVPEGHTLHVAARGEVFGGALYIVDSSETELAIVTLSPPGSNELFNNPQEAILMGPAVVKIWAAVTGGSPENSYLTLQSLDAIILPNGVTPPATGNHMPGRGSSGFKFGASAPYEYNSAVTGHRSLSVELIEVGEWQK